MTAGMRAGILFAALLAGVAAAAWAQVPPGPTEAFLEGNRRYQAGDFSGAVAAYSDILARGKSAPELEFNLANAHLKAGETGRAILHYRRALRLRPAYESAELNLAYARSLTQDMKEEAPPGAAWRWVGRLRLGPGPAGALLFLVTLLFLSLAGLRVLGRLPGWAVPCQWGLLGAGLLLVAALVFEWRELEGRREGVVLAAEIDVRTGPAETQTVSFRLHEGTEVGILRAAAGWVEIRVTEELRGWIPESALEPI